MKNYSKKINLLKKLEVLLCDNTVNDNNLDVYVPTKGEYKEMKHNNPTNQQKLPFIQKIGRWAH